MHKDIESKSYEKMCEEERKTCWPWERGSRVVPTNEGVGQGADEHGPVKSAQEIVRPDGTAVSRIYTYADGTRGEIVLDKKIYAPGLDKMPLSPIRGATYCGAPVVGHTKNTITDHMITEAMLSHDYHVGTKRTYFDASGNPVEVTRRGNGIAEARWNGRVIRYNVNGEITPRGGGKTKKSWWPF